MQEKKLKKDKKVESVRFDQATLIFSMEQDTAWCLESSALLVVQNTDSQEAWGHGPLNMF